MAKCMDAAVFIHCECANDNFELYSHLSSWVQQASCLFYHVGSSKTFWQPHRHLVHIFCSSFYQNSHCYEFTSQSRRIICGLSFNSSGKYELTAQLETKHRVYAARQRFGALGIGEFSWLGQSCGHNLWRKRHKIMGVFSCH